MERDHVGITFYPSGVSEVLSLDNVHGSNGSRGGSLRVGRERREVFSFGSYPGKVDSGLAVHRTSFCVVTS